MSDPATFVFRAREVLAKATPGPLESNQHGEVRTVALDRLSIGFYSQSLSCGRNRSYAVTPDQATANAAASVLAVNSLAALCNVVEAAVALRTFVTPDPYESTEGNEWNTTLSALDSAIARLKVPE